MKTKRIVVTVLGWLFIFFQAAGYLSAIGRRETPFKQNNIGYIIGFNFMLALGITFLLMASRQKRKMRRKAEQEQINSFLLSAGDSKSNHNG